MAFSFTSERLSEAMLERAWEGVDIHGVMEKRGSGSRYSEYVRFIVESSRLRKTRADLKQLTLAINRALSGKSSESWGEIKEMAAEIRPAGRKRRSRLSRYLREIEKLARRLESAEDPGSKGGRVLQNQVKEFLPGGKRYFRPGRIRVVRDKNPGVMHHKVIVIDGRILVTGSYNFSRSADTRNDENTIIIQDPSLACRYIQEFNRLVPGSHRVFCGK
jgi:phosphatidylserine/phosphatidylglycerophosphate/cardiolipin synthase-like enzyme